MNFIGGRGRKGWASFGGNVVAHLRGKKMYTTGGKPAPRLQGGASACEGKQQPGKEGAVNRGNRSDSEGVVFAWETRM